jgi:HEAT repeat protein
MAAAGRRGAIFAASTAVAGTCLLVVWPDAQDPPASRPVQNDRSESEVQAAPEHPATKPPPSTPRGTPGADNRDALAVLVVALSDADANVRADAVSELGLSSEAQAESLLAVTAMQDPAPVVRIEALYALGTLRAESQLATFRHALNDPTTEVRKAAISALEELGGDASSTLLASALSDRDPAVRAAAADALSDIRSAR